MDNIIINTERASEQKSKRVKFSILNSQFSILIFVVMLSVSCSKWLDLEPYDGVMEDNYWNTKEDVHKFTIGLYSSLLNSSLIDRIILWGELRADMLRDGPNANSSHLNVVRGEINPDNLIVQWDRFYYTINQCNKLIEGAPLALERDRTFSETLYRQYIAEATVIRSLMYFYLIRSFKDVPLLLKATNSDSEISYPAKTEESVILDSLVNQLSRVVDRNHLPVSYANNADSKGRITRWTAMTLLADVYLWQGDYAGCNDMCNRVIRSEQFTLIPVQREAEEIRDPATDALLGFVYIPNSNDIDFMFDLMFVEGNCVETIFEFQFPATHPSLTDRFYELFNNGGRPLVWANTQTTEGYIYPYEERSRAAIDIRGNNFAYKSSNNIVWKYTGLSRQNNETRTLRQYPNWIVYRLPDVMLMKAEALNQLAMAGGNDQQLFTEAYQLVQAIRERGNAVETSETQLNFPIDGDALDRLILFERAREFAFEGKRWYDVLRFARRNNFAKRSYLKEMAIYSTPPEKLVSLQTKYDSDWFLYWPIYYADVESNPQLEQNPFYSYFKK